MRCDDLIDLAGKLVVNKTIGNAEARFRSCVSRSYYGVFHCAIEVLAELGATVPGNHKGHEEAYRKLYCTQVTEAVAAAHLLNELRGDRNEADYALNKPRFSKQINAMVAVENAKDAVTNLRKCLEEPLLSQLRRHFEASSAH